MLRARALNPTVLGMSEAGGPSLVEVPPASHFSCIKGPLNDRMRYGTLKTRLVRNHI